MNASKLSRLIVLSLAVSLAWPAASASAAPPASATKPGKKKRGKKKRGQQRPDPTKPDPEIIEQARGLSDEAFLRFDTRDYAGAVSQWRDATALLPLDALYADYRRHFSIQIAYAYKQSYLYSGEREELDAAREQFEGYRASLPLDDASNRGLIATELEELDALMHEAKREALARRQEAYDDYLQNYARFHGGAGVYRNGFAIGRGAEPADVLKGYKLLRQIGEPRMAKNFRRYRAMSFTGWSLSGAGFFVMFFSLPFRSTPVGGGVAGAAGAVLATGIGLGVGGLVGLRRMDVEGAMRDYNADLARERGLLPPVVELPGARRRGSISRLQRGLTRVERATGFRMGITVQGLTL